VPVSAAASVASARVLAPAQAVAVVASALAWAEPSVLAATIKVRSDLAQALALVRSAAVAPVPVAVVQRQVQA
jgi:hypothetical protein